MKIFLLLEDAKFRNFVVPDFIMAPTGIPRRTIRPVCFKERERERERGKQAHESDERVGLIPLHEKVGELAIWSVGAISCCLFFLSYQGDLFHLRFKAVGVKSSLAAVAQNHLVLGVSLAAHPAHQGVVVPQNFLVNAFLAIKVPVINFAPAKDPDARAA